MRQTGIITELYLKENGFKFDETAPVGVVRYEKKQKGYTTYYVSVTFHDRKPDWIYMLRTDYNLNGAVEKYTKWHAGGRVMDVEDLLEGAKELGIEL